MRWPWQAKKKRILTEADLPPPPQPVDLHDPMEGQKLSLMHKQKVLCNGEASGKQCKHYWTLVQIASSAAPTHLRSGERTRMCVYQRDAEPVVFDDGREGMATSCNRYEPDTSPVFDTRGVFKDEHFIVTAEGAERKYEPTEEEFNPLAPHHIKMVERGELTSFRQLYALEEHERIHGPPKAPEKPAAEPQTISVKDALGAQEQP